MRNRGDLVGKQFGRLTVIGRCNNDIPQKDSKWYCECQCGNHLIVQRSNLRSGHTQSCGCLKMDSNTTHGKCYTRLWRIWVNIKSRCENPNTPNFSNYGARGISICSEWENDFQAFYDWAMSNGYQENLTIDRIDVNGNYDPLNCRWADQITQGNNKRTNHFLTYNGKTQTIAQWANEMGIKQGTLLSRINRLNWSVERALQTK